MPASANATTHVIRTPRLRRRILALLLSTELASALLAEHRVDVVVGVAARARVSALGRRRGRGRTVGMTELLGEVRARLGAERREIFVDDAQQSLRLGTVALQK